jgi:predicted dehydrogenase
MLIDFNKLSLGLKFSMMQINWGIIGCGDVTEVKSGPAFNKVPHSSLIAVMRRDAAKAKDYAIRHGVPKYYTDANALINDPDINAIYIATPPDSHEAYSLAAIAAGKPVYVEKPMTLHTASAERMVAAAHDKQVKLAVAHYRREQPLYKRLKELIDSNIIGPVRLVKLSMIKKRLTADQLQIEKTSWRVNTAIAGGGLFHDLAPHQLDILYYLFGEAAKVQGLATNQSGIYQADDMVTANILFNNGVMFQGNWCFSIAAAEEADVCEIIGEGGKISFSFFNTAPVTVIGNGIEQVYSFPALAHVQQPMIEKVVAYFSGNGDNPCSGEEGVTIMRWMDAITG